jgi:CheY-like chemotaxis protein
MKKHLPPIPLDILYVEDVASFREVFKAQLQKNLPNARITAVGNIAEAVAALQNRNFDLAFLDWDVGDAGEGRSVLQAIRHSHTQSNPMMPVIFVSEVAASIRKTFDALPDGPPANVSVYDKRAFLELSDNGEALSYSHGILAGEQETRFRKQLQSILKDIPTVAPFIKGHKRD